MTAALSRTAPGLGRRRVLLSMISAHRSTHSLQMNTPGPATIVSTAAGGFTQNVQQDVLSASGADAVSVSVMLSSSFA